MNEHKTRLYVVSSPHNALACIAMIKQDNERNPNESCQDYAIIWDAVSYDLGKSHRIVQTIMKMLSTHNFTSIIDCSGIQRGLQNSFLEGNIDECKHEIFSRLEINEFDELYVIRNSQIFRLLTFLSQNAKIIVYGETYFKIDSAIGSEYSKIDLLRLILPIDFSNGLLNAIPLDVTPKQYLLQAIADVLEGNMEDKMRIVKLSEQFAGQKKGECSKCVVLALQYASDIGGISINDENSLYIDSLNNYCNYDTKIIIKEHPRTLSLRKSERIRNTLIKAGYTNVYVLDRELNCYPIEVIRYLFHFDAVISPISSSALILKYLYGIDYSLGGGSDMITRRNGVAYQYAIYQMFKEALNNLSKWNPLDNKPLATYNGQAIFTLRNGNKIFAPKNCNVTKSRLFDLMRDNSIPFITQLVARYIESFAPETMLAIFDELCLKNVALYGVGIIGKIIIDKLLASNNDIELYLIDSNSTENSYKNLKIHKLNDEPPNVAFDAIICSVMHSYDAIVTSLLRSKLRENMIYSFAEMLDIYLSEHLLVAIDKSKGVSI